MAIPCTLLAVEDEDNDVLLLRTALQKAGVSNPVAVVHDGQEAVDYLSGKTPFDDRALHPLPILILLDLKMPRLNGFDVLKWLRRQPGLKRLLVTVLTSSDQPDDINRAYDLGANSYLLKPHNSGDLSELVAQVKRYWLDLNQQPVALTE